MLSKVMKFTQKNVQTIKFTHAKMLASVIVIKVCKNFINKLYRNIILKASEIELTRLNCNAT